MGKNKIIIEKIKNERSRQVREAKPNQFSDIIKETKTFFNDEEYNCNKKVIHIYQV